MVWIEDRPLDCVEARVRTRWHFLLDMLCLSPATRRQKEDCFADLAARHRRPERYYHTLHHLADMLDVLLRMLPLAPRLDLLGLAVYFHDVVYDTTAADNEERSAAYAGTALAELGLTPVVIDEVRRLILLTKAHEAAPDDITGNLFLDADLAILGAQRTRYAAYTRAVRQEYFWVPEEQYRVGRTQVLRRFLHRNQIYFCQRLFHRREARARRNLHRELAELSGTSAG